MVLVPFIEVKEILIDRIFTNASCIIVQSNSGVDKHGLEAQKLLPLSNGNHNFTNYGSLTKL